MYEISLLNKHVVKLSGLLPLIDDALAVLIDDVEGLFDLELEELLLLDLLHRAGWCR